MFSIGLFQNLSEWIIDKEEVEIVDLILKIKEKLVSYFVKFVWYYHSIWYYHSGLPKLVSSCVAPSIYSECIPLVSCTGIICFLLSTKFHHFFGCVSVSLLCSHYQYLNFHSHIIFISVLPLLFSTVLVNPAVMCHLYTCTHICFVITVFTYNDFHSQFTSSFLYFHFHISTHYCVLCLITISLVSL